MGGQLLSYCPVCTLVGRRRSLGAGDYGGQSGPAGKRYQMLHPVLPVWTVRLAESAPGLQCLPQTPDPRPQSSGCVRSPCSASRAPPPSLCSTFLSLHIFIYLLALFYSMFIFPADGALCEVRESSGMWAVHPPGKSQSRAS